MLTCALSDDSSHSFRYSRAQPWITEVLVGAETLEQLQELIELCKTPPLTADQVEEVDATLPKAPPDLLNPGKWLENIFKISIILNIYSPLPIIFLHYCLHHLRISFLNVMELKC